MGPADYDQILTLCASCGSHIKQTDLRRGTGEWGSKARQLAAKLMDFSSFLTEVLKVSPEEFLARNRKWPTTPPATCAGETGLPGNS